MSHFNPAHVEKRHRVGQILELSFEVLYLHRTLTQQHLFIYISIIIMSIIMPCLFLRIWGFNAIWSFPISKLLALQKGSQTSAASVSNILPPSNVKQLRPGICQITSRGRLADLRRWKLLWKRKSIVLWQCACVSLSVRPPHTLPQMWIDTRSHTHTT